MEDEYGMGGLGFSLDPISGILGAGASIFSTIQAPKLLKDQTSDQIKLMKLQDEQRAGTIRKLGYAAIGIGIFALTYAIVKGAVSRKD